MRIDIYRRENMRAYNKWSWTSLPLLVLLALNGLAYGGSVTIGTSHGWLIGTQKNSISSFKGIPYAQAPVGQLRWKPALPAPVWKGERLADNFGPVCMQKDRAKKVFFYTPLSLTSEDCLYLNVWTSVSSGVEKKQPVMVWIHGGGLVGGSASEPGFDGAQLARKGVVVVSFNYRLGVFGYFSHPELTAESPHRSSGNYGTTDQIQALKWVQKNIAAFGGDPDNITIFGESAGALSVTHLLASPLAEGLFHRAIAQSPYLQPIPALHQHQLDKPPAEETGLQFAKQAGNRSLAELRALPASVLLQEAAQAAYYPEAVLDNWVFQQQPFNVFAQGKQQPVPVLAGFNSGEGYHMAAYGRAAPIPTDPKSYSDAVKARYGALSDAYLAAYPPNDLREAVYAPIRDAFYGWAAETLVRAASDAGEKAYFYYFDHVTPWMEAIGMGAHHAAEIPYIFNQVHQSPRLVNWPEYVARDLDIELADLMSDYWVAFAKNGTPDIKNKPVWSPYKKEGVHHYMAFHNGKAIPERDLHPGVFELHQRIFSDRKSRHQSWRSHNIGLLAPLLEKTPMTTRGQDE